MDRKAGLKLILNSGQRTNSFSGVSQFPEYYASAADQVHERLLIPDSVGRRGRSV